MYDNYDGLLAVGIGRREVSVSQDLLRQMRDQGYIEYEVAAFDIHMEGDEEQGRRLKHTMRLGGWDDETYDSLHWLKLNEEAQGWETTAEWVRVGGEEVGRQEICRGESLRSVRHRRSGHPHALRARRESAGGAAEGRVRPV